VLWCVYGYSLAFTEGNAVFGGFGRLFLKGAAESMAATFSKATVLPELVFVAFQATFAAITCCLILGAFAERARFGAVLSWMFAEWMLKGKPSMLGATSGAVAGLVAITPAAGNVGIPGAFAIGIAAGIVCLWGVNGLKRLLRVDDSLDVFGVHALGGILGALMTGIFNSPDLGGPGLVTDWVTGKTGYPGYLAQLWIQAKAVGLTVAWSAVVAFVAYKIVDATLGLRVPEDKEREGLDVTEHGESAYNM
jgi:ammonia channel protein AmtB